MEQARVLIVSDEAEFVNSLVQSWQRSSSKPEYSVSSMRGNDEFPESSVAVIDGSDPTAANHVLARLSAKVPLAIAITGDQPLSNPGSAVSRVMQIGLSAGCVDVVAALAYETVLRVGAMQQVAEVENRLKESQRFAALGHFIADARHGLGNALTCVLGNSELVLLETAGTELRCEVRGQMETIHAMSLKIHETLHRLSSLDMEMQVAERQARRET